MLFLYAIILLNWPLSLSLVKKIKAVDLPNRHNIQEKDLSMKRLGSVLQLAYNRQIDNFEDLLLLKGVGPRTLKALALTSEVIHGDSSRFDDPSRFSFAVGGKMEYLIQLTQRRMMKPLICSKIQLKKQK